MRWGDNRAVLIERMQRAMARLVDELWAARDPAVGLDEAHDAVVLASVVEKETGVADEMPVIAGVFHNRLRQGMRLQADPTVIYALTGGKKPLGRALRRADLWVESPYNTYRNKGLPPGPIANPGRAALAAVLQPGRNRRALLRCRRLRRACVREDPGRAQPQRRALAREAGQGKEIAAEGASMEDMAGQSPA